MLGANVTTLMRYKEHPTPDEHGLVPPSAENRLMHANFSSGDSTLMASDRHCRGKPNFEGFSLSLSVRGDGEAQRLFATLADGGQLRAPLSKPFFYSRFGMVAFRRGLDGHRATLRCQ